MALSNEELFITDGKWNAIFGIIPFSFEHDVLRSSIKVNYKVK